MTMPSPHYDKNLRVFERLFARGVSTYVQPTGMTGYKIVPGVPESGLDPYYVSPFPQRAKNPGDITIFLAETPHIASCECFGNTDFSGAPTNTWLLHYRYQGQMLNIGAVSDESFREEFLRWSGNAKHEFSQDFKHYLGQQGYANQCDSIGWQSVSGDRVGSPGFVIAWHSGVSGEFHYEDKQRIA